MNKVEKKNSKKLNKSNDDWILKAVKSQEEFYKKLDNMTPKEKVEWKLKTTQRDLELAKAEKNPWSKPNGIVFGGPYNEWQYEHDEHIFRLERFIEEYKQELKTYS